MKFTRTVILILSVIFIAAIFYWALFIPKEDVSQRIYKTLKEQERRPDLSFKDVTFAEIVEGKKFWELKASSAWVNKSTGIATLQKSKGTFYKEGKEVLRFVSPAALWDMKQKEIYLDKPLGYDIVLEPKIESLIAALKKENLSVFNLPREYQKEKNYWFKANNLSWKVADQLLLCTGGILLNKGEVTGYSQKLKSDVALEKVTLEGNPKIIIVPAQTYPITLEADLFEIVSPEDLIEASGSPRVFWGEARVVSGILKYLQREKKLMLTQGTKINYRDILAWGDSAEYLVEEEKIILEGNASALQQDNKLSGDKVLISLKDQKISLIGKGRVTITEEELEKEKEKNQ